MKRKVVILNTHTPINCDLHDYIEIACTFGYEIAVECVNGNKWIGVARDTGNNKNVGEWITISTENDEQRNILLSSILHIVVLTEQAKFKRLMLSPRENAHVEH
ncbi:Rho-binding antiterminator [Pleionea sp. CnH1-48]|uniref:Rho-binding antiterminator n=1 Tax=Pleionea sp. CnH1-48 TaxID=2954494 RepID=UPI0020970883|nr:Rho-binding antiterminator [Pleionea sp. CnH1-48]MCO7223553.1 Rho-binding antiterminator [Pleionea sp. CnH1-48]